MAESRLHLIAELVEESIRKDNDLLQAEVEKLQRRLHLHQNMYRILNQSHDGISANLMIMRRVLHEIFSEDPELRMAYRPMMRVKMKRVTTMCGRETLTAVLVLIVMLALLT